MIRRTKSRTVIIPSNFSPSQTGMAPTSSYFIFLTTSAVVALGEIMSTEGVMILLSCGLTKSLLAYICRQANA